MRFLRLVVSPHLSRFHRNPNPSSHSAAAAYSTTAPETPPLTKNASASAGEAPGLSPQELADLTEVLRQKLGMKEIPPEILNPEAEVEKKQEEEDDDKFDFELDCFDAAPKKKDEAK